MGNQIIEGLNEEVTMEVYEDVVKSSSNTAIKVGVGLSLVAVLVGVGVTIYKKRKARKAVLNAEVVESEENVENVENN